MLTALGALAPLLLLGEGLFRRDMAHLRIGVALLGCLVTGGALGGLLHGATARLRARGGAGAAGSWATIGCATLVTAMLGARSVAGMAALPGLEGERIALLTSWPAIGRLALVGAVFGALMAHTNREGESTPLLVGFSDEIPQGTVLTWTALALMIWTVTSFVGGGDGLPVPETEREAKGILASAEREAIARPNDEHSQFVLAMCLMHVGRLDDAKPVFARALVLNPNDDWAHNALGWTLFQQRKFADAVPHFQEAIRLNGKYVIAYHNLGLAQLNLHHADAAEAPLREAARLDPRAADAAADYAFALYQRDKRKLALQYIQRASRLAPDNVRYHAMTAELLRTQARFAESSAEFRVVTRLAPKQFYGWVQLGITEYLAGNAPAAAAALTEGERLNPKWFEDHPMDRAMLLRAREGRTGEIEVSRTTRPTGSTIHTAGR